RGGARLAGARLEEGCRDANRGNPSQRVTDLRGASGRGEGRRMASRVRLLVAAAVLAAVLVVPPGSPAHASTRCDPLRYNSRTNPLREKASNGALLVEYHVTVS